MPDVKEHATPLGLPAAAATRPFSMIVAPKLRSITQSNKSAMQVRPPCEQWISYSSNAGTATNVSSVTHPHAVDKGADIEWGVGRERIGAPGQQWPVG